MARRLVMSCEQCGQEIEDGVGEYVVTRNDKEHGASYLYDFCSHACYDAWHDEAHQVAALEEVAESKPVVAEESA